MRLLVFGITGSIGQTLLKVLDHHHLVGVSFYAHQIQAQTIINNYHVPYYWSPINPAASNVTSIDELILKTKPDLIVNAVSGYAGLQFSLKAIEHKIDLALANKESLVMAGHIIMSLIQQAGLHLYPIDSEHSAMADLLTTCKRPIKRLYITCSGGSCYQLSAQQRQQLTYAQIIKHPNWNMGEKISFDSATLLNKCFEIVECFHLFQTKDISALYHPQSVVHALVEYADHSIFAHLAHPDMQLAIQAALNHFHKADHAFIQPLNFKGLNLTFDTIDQQVWKPIQWAMDIINDQNHSLGVIITVANEHAIAAFKRQEITFNQFYDYIEKYINQYKHYRVDNLVQLNMLMQLLLNH